MTASLDPPASAAGACRRLSPAERAEIEEQLRAVRSLAAGDSRGFIGASARQCSVAAGVVEPLRFSS
jgi:hypothetical protein